MTHAHARIVLTCCLTTRPQTHAQNTTLFMYSDMLLIRQDRKPAVPIKFFPSKGSIHLIRNPFDSIYSWFQYRSVRAHDFGGFTQR